MAGMGKSTIARTVAQSFASRGQLGASFFFKKGERERGNASRFFTTIASDLVVHEPGVVPGIRKALDKDSKIADKSLRDQFEKLILQHNLTEHLSVWCSMLLPLDAFCIFTMSLKGFLTPSCNGASSCCLFQIVRECMTLLYPISTASVRS
jgi:hypothetical protein